ncbi:MAG: hypothetical protein ACM3O7_08355 [Acidobacteriota bacterium]
MRQTWVPLAILCLLGAGTATAMSMGQLSVTPDLSVPPLHHFRIDLGGLFESSISSLKSGLEGDLYGPYLSISYGAASNAVLTVDGMAYKTFAPQHGAEGSSGPGDFAVWGKFLLGQDDRRDRAYGVRFGAKLPNTPSNKDFGTNRTDFFMHVFGGLARGPWEFDGYGGLGILERPGEPASQDDVAMVGLLVKRAVASGSVRVEVEGFTKSQLYGDNWALHVTYEHRFGPTWGAVIGGQLSKGRFYGSGEGRVGLVFWL